MTYLSVNLNKIALLRNGRGGNKPCVLQAAQVCLDAGAFGITVHPRPDARHIRADDVLALAQLCHARGVELNIEGNPFAPPRAGYPGFFALCEQARPAQATLVPDGDNQLTSDHGFDFIADAKALTAQVAALQQLGCRVSLFADVGAPMQAAAATGANRIELYTGPYAQAFANGQPDAALAACRASADAAVAAGLGVNAGHDLNQQNLPALIAMVPAIAEVSIGHALVDEALYQGLDSTVRAYVQILSRSR